MDEHLFRLFYCPSSPLVREAYYSENYGLSVHSLSARGLIFHNL